MRDITERKRAESELRQAEERMRSVVDHVIDGIITIDVRREVQSFNPAAEKLFGYAKEEVIGNNVKMLMPEPYYRQHDSYISNYTGTGVAKMLGRLLCYLGSRQVRGSGSKDRKTCAAFEGRVPSILFLGPPPPL